MLHYPQDYIDDVSVRFAYHSNGIEGNSLTRGQTQAIMLNDTITVTGFKNIKLRDVYEAANQKSAFDLLLSLAVNNAPLNTETILKLQFELTKNTIATAGKFKQNENYIVGADFSTASVYETPFLVQQWLENTNYQLNNAQSQDEILRILIESHIKFERIHPFDDGNGRTGREIINLELAKHDMPFLVIEKDDKPQYVTFEQENDVGGLFDYAKQKLQQEKKRYEIFEKNYREQSEFEKNK